ncbi:hypothetical protein DFP72DRAFT_1078396 [Ephemerocybe angulata]|uniref:Uncharacterized protein n=1 Tax=Ephemerocybe angulata TaxID=980116 RepID=A0A8H6HE53_9AGAR|nr:hypothetical protein DFP72DRAFT_1078396 [Tulosesus angulatus]
MPRITRDPNLEEMPDFDAEEFQTTFQALATEDNTLEAITQRSKDAWTASHQKKLEAWQAQVAEDAEAERQLEEERAREEQEREAAKEESRRLEKAEKDKKKPKVKAFVANKLVNTFAAIRTSQYAINKVKSLEYIELWYWTPEGCADAATQDRTVSSTVLALTSEGGIGQALFTPAAAHKVSTKVVADEKITWRDMSVAKTGLLQCMRGEENWPEEHVMALGSFFLELDHHELRRRDYGEEALLLYQAEVRREWHEQLRSTDDTVEPFDIGVINETRLMRIYDKLLSQKHAQGIARSVVIVLSNFTRALT